MEQPENLASRYSITFHTVCQLYLFNIFVFLHFTLLYDGQLSSSNNWNLQKQWGLNCCCVCFPFLSRSYISFIIWFPSYFCVSYIIHQKCSTILLKMGWSLRRLKLNTWSFKVWILASFVVSRLRGLLYLYFVFLCCICILYFYMYAGWGWRLPPCLWWPLITTRWHTLPKPK